MNDNDRLELQALLEELLGSRYVYYQPPKGTIMNYPAIRYSKSNIDTKHANDTIYKKRKRYELTVIDKKPDNPVVDKLLYLPYCSYDRQYVADNLYHDIFTLYY